MARVPYPTREEYPEAYRAVYDRMIKERGPRGPIILMSARPDTFRRPASEQDALEPLEIAELCRMIKVRQTH